MSYMMAAGFWVAVGAAAILGKHRSPAGRQQEQLLNRELESKKELYELIRGGPRTDMGLGRSSRSKGRQPSNLERIKLKADLKMKQLFEQLRQAEANPVLKDPATHWPFD
ncbi:hypothetical protein CFC21_040038 [Triticum aestivum]|uniref:Uncharacterized protein n=2 Tax=Triticum aestivum TaxID=4565 RepID=A0A3B6FKF0_WHEAT|nr:hypothetical protein CFC21_040038 [Triticum aestivum]